MGTGRLYYRLGTALCPPMLNLARWIWDSSSQRDYEGVDDPEDVYQDDDGIWHIKAGAAVRVTPARWWPITGATTSHWSIRCQPGWRRSIPRWLSPERTARSSAPHDRYGWWWWGTWYEHQNMRDERAEAFATLLWDGVYNYTYVARATPRAPSSCRLPKPRRCTRQRCSAAAPAIG